MMNTRGRWAALAFALALATKISSIGIPPCWSRRRSPPGGPLSIGILWRLALLVGVFLALVWWMRAVALRIMARVHVCRRGDWRHAADVSGR
jgi:hypothetical protein